MLYLPTQYEYVSVIMTVTINDESVVYSSYLTKNYETILFTNEQALALGRYFVLILNARLSKGWITVDPEIGLVKYRNVNHSLGSLQRRIEKVPQDLAEDIFKEVIEIEKNWRKVLPYIFGLLDIWEKKVLNHPYWHQHQDP